MWCCSGFLAPASGRALRLSVRFVFSVVAVVAAVFFWLFFWFGSVPFCACGGGFCCSVSWLLLPVWLCALLWFFLWLLVWPCAFLYLPGVSLSGVVELRGSDGKFLPCTFLSCLRSYSCPLSVLGSLAHGWVVPLSGCSHLSSEASQVRFTGKNCPGT